MSSPVYNKTYQFFSVVCVFYFDLCCVLFCYVCIDTESHYIARAGWKLVSSSDPPNSASGIAGLSDMHHHGAWYISHIFKQKRGKWKYMDAVNFKILVEWGNGK